MVTYEAPYSLINEQAHTFDTLYSEPYTKVFDNAEDAIMWWLLTFAPTAKALAAEYPKARYVAVEIRKHVFDGDNELDCTCLDDDEVPEGFPYPCALYSTEERRFIHY